MRIVVLAAGDFPRKGSEGERLLRSAEVVIACDSAALGYFRRFRHWPTVTIGDLDSLPREVRQGIPKLIQIGEQETNDLAKALGYVFKTYPEVAPSSVVVVGATGGREDHTIGNIYQALDAGVRMVTEAGEFVPIAGRCKVKTFRGQGISLFASDPQIEMCSKGLVWSLKGVKFERPYTATLNRAAGEWVEVTGNRPAYLYLAREMRAERAVVSLGSNLGNRAGYLRRALQAVEKLPGTRLVDVSKVLETEGVGVPEEYAELKFLNQVALFETVLGPLEFARALHAIEDKLGRVRTVRNGPRTIDLDLITWGEVRMETEELTLPHPRAKQRPFVMRPLKELGLSL